MGKLSPMALNLTPAIHEIAAAGSEWQRYRARRLLGQATGAAPEPDGQTEDGAFAGPAGGPSPGATGLELCHLEMLGLMAAAAAKLAVTWLEAIRTPAGLWEDEPSETPGELDTPRAGQVWATASAACGLLAAGRDPGPRALDELRGLVDTEGYVMGGAYTTAAAAGVWWLADGPGNEIAETSLDWAARHADGWGIYEVLAALTFWAGAGIPRDHPAVRRSLSQVRALDPVSWDDPEPVLRAAETVAYFRT